MITIDFMNELPKELQAVAENEQISYETSKGVECNYTPFNFTAKKGNEIAGIVSGYTCYSEVYIDDIVVMAEHRDCGIGKNMLQAVEEYFSDMKFNNINLVTSGFQAPEFYKKCGFTLEYIRHNDQNSLLTKYFFVKFFS